GRAQAVRHLQREVISAPGHQRHLDSSPCRFLNRVAVGVGQPPPAVEQRTVYIEGNEPDRHTFILPCIRASQSYSYEACDEQVRAVLAAAAKQNDLKKPVLKSSAYANTQALLRRFIPGQFQRSGSELRTFVGSRRRRLWTALGRCS